MTAILVSRWQVETRESLEARRPASLVCTVAANEKGLSHTVWKVMTDVQGCPLTSMACCGTYRGRTLVLLQSDMLCFVDRGRVDGRGAEERQGTEREERKEGKLQSGWKINEKFN